jgi:hypothetical protein
LQILATEHWSLLATRSLTYNEALSRVTIFLAILSGAVIAIALVAQADGFGPTAISIAIPVLCVVLFAGVVSVGRLIRLNSDDYRWVIGMNRIRHAYIEMHPDLAGYFVASPYDDAARALQTLGIERSTIASAGAGFNPSPGPDAAWHGRHRRRLRRGCDWRTRRAGSARFALPGFARGHNRLRTDHRDDGNLGSAGGQTECSHP